MVWGLFPAADFGEHNSETTCSMDERNFSMHWATISFLRKVLWPAVWEEHKHQMRYIPVLSCQPPESLNNGDTLSRACEYILFFLLIRLKVSSWVCLEAGYCAVWIIDLLSLVSTFLHRPPWVHVWGLHAEWGATRPLCISRDLLRAFYWLRHYRGSPTPDAVKSIFHFSFVSSSYISFSFFVSLVSVCLSRLDAQMRNKFTRQSGTVFMSCFWLTRESRLVL